MKLASACIFGRFRPVKLYDTVQIVTIAQMRYLWPMTQIKDGRGRTTKQDWLDTALTLLRSNGIEGVRVERMSAKLGVAKSGFYYHFKDLNGLHAALLKHWVELDRGPVTTAAIEGDGKPEVRLMAIAESVDNSNLSRFDAAIRQWAKHDTKVRRVWRKEMNGRLSLIRCIFEDAGFRGSDLEMRTRLFVAYSVSEREIFNELTAEERKELRKARIELLTKG